MPHGHGPRQLQIGDIRTSDQQHSRYGDHKNKQRLAIITGEMTLQRLDNHPAVSGKAANSTG